MWFLIRGAFWFSLVLVMLPIFDEDASTRLKNEKGEYLWGASDLPMRAGRMAASNALSVHFKVPPREIVFLHRRLAGVFIMLATLHGELNARDMLLKYLGEP